MKWLKQSVLTRRYILILLFLISFLFILIVFIIQKTLNDISISMLNQLKDTTVFYIESSNYLIDSLKSDTSKLIKSIKKAENIIEAYILKPTDDDRYYKIIYKIKSLNPTKKKIKYDDSKNFLISKGLVNLSINPSLFVDNKHSWIESYSPIYYKNKRCVLFIKWDVSDIIILQKHNSLVLKDFKLIISILIFLSILFLILSIVFYTNEIKQKYYQIIKTIKAFIINNNKKDDLIKIQHELNYITSPFSELIEELKDIDFNNNPEKIIFKKAVNLMKEEEYNKAIILFKAFIILKNNSFASFFNLGVCYAKIRDYDEALKYFYKAKSLNPNYKLLNIYINKVHLLKSNINKNE